MHFLRSHSSKIVLILILFLAFFSRFHFFSQEGFITTDGARYAFAGGNLIENGRYEVAGKPELTFPPGYPLAIGVVNHFSGDLLFSARFVSFVAGLLSVLLFYFVGKELDNKETGLFASFFAATHWMLIVASVVTMSESLYLFFVLLAVYVYLKIAKRCKTLSASTPIRREVRLAIFLGLAIGISYLIRPEGMVFLVLAFTPLFQKNKDLDFRKVVSIPLTAFLAFFVVAAPYVYFLYQNTGRISLTAKSKPNLVTGMIFAGEAMENAGESTADFYEKVFFHYDEKANAVRLPEKFRNAGIAESVIKKPDEFLKRYRRGIESEIGVLFDYYIGWILLIPLLVFSVFVAGKKEQLGKLSALFLPAALLALIFPAFHLESRYLLQVFIFIILAASLGCSLVNKLALLAAKKRKFVSAVFFGFINFIVIYATLVSFAASFYAIGIPRHPEHKKAGMYLENKIGESAKKIVIMSRKPFVAFYAGVEKNIPIPYTNPKNTIKFAKASKVDYIVIDKRFLEARSNYDEMMNLDKYSDDVSLFYEDDSVSPIKIFKLSHNGSK